MNMMEYSYNVILVMFYTIALSVCFFTYGETKRPVMKLYGFIMLAYIFESYFVAIFNGSGFNERFPMPDFAVMAVFSWIELYPLGMIRPTVLNGGKAGPAEKAVPAIVVALSLLAAVVTRDVNISYAFGGLCYAAGCVFYGILYFAGFRTRKTHGGRTGAAGGNAAAGGTVSEGTVSPAPWATGSEEAAEEYVRHRGFFLFVIVFNSFACAESILALCGLTNFVFQYIPDYLEAINFASDACTLVISFWIIDFCQKERQRAFHARMESMLQQRMNEFQAIQAEKQQQTTEAQLQEFCRCYDLTPREQDILRFVLQGKTNQELSRELFISEGTVKTHLHSIYRKLNVSRRSQLMNRFFSYGGDAASDLRKGDENRKDDHLEG